MISDKKSWIIEATITDMQQAMASGALTSMDLVQLYLERIQTYDGELRSIIELNPDALRIAKELDQEREAGAFAGHCTAFLSF
ncbi:3-oxoacyl-[acyl-carrier-protein] synthase, KASIII [Paenibacillus sp. JCM 10914]|nr:3-oxoacyl-[acyl-carrier-protein] synthase, KASIII [Paenibacillus sp. JCM 10914]